MCQEFLSDQPVPDTGKTEIQTFSRVSSGYISNVREDTAVKRIQFFVGHMTVGRCKDFVYRQMIRRIQILDDC